MLHCSTAKRDSSGHITKEVHLTDKENREFIFDHPSIRRTLFRGAFPNLIAAGAGTRILIAELKRRKASIAADTLTTTCIAVSCKAIVF